MTVTNAHTLSPCISKLSPVFFFFFGQIKNVSAETSLHESFAQSSFVQGGKHISGVECGQLKRFAALQLSQTL